jgi:hypothetical protein
MAIETGPFVKTAVFVNQALGKGLGIMGEAVDDLVGIKRRSGRWSYTDYLCGPAERVEKGKEGKQDNRQEDIFFSHNAPFLSRLGLLIFLKIVIEQ